MWEINLYLLEKLLLLNYVFFSVMGKAFEHVAREAQLEVRKDRLEHDGNYNLYLTIKSKF